MTAAKHRRNAVTLLEALVVFGLLGVLIGLLLPALQQSRETAARTRCLNNVQRIAQAVHGYADTHNSELVPLCVYNPRATDSAFPRQYDSCFFLLLPYLGEGYLYHLLREQGDNWSFAARVPGAPTPSTFLQTQANVKVYNCPLASDYKLTLGPGSTPLQNYTNYAVNYLLLGVKNPGLEKAPSSDPFTCGPRFTIENIPVGTSNTLLLAEKNSQFNFWDRPAPVDPIYAPMIGCVLNASAPFPYSFWGPYTADALAKPLHVSEPGNWSFQRPSTVHRGGIVIGLVDGSVRGVTSAVSLSTWRFIIDPEHDGPGLNGDW
jgi:type II secretory pathway pseudopilin PulG